MKKVTATIRINSEPPKPTTFEDLGYVQVVRCKDCKHQNEYRTGSCPFYTTWGSVAPDDWFCADGEQKDD